MRWLYRKWGGITDKYQRMLTKWYHITSLVTWSFCFKNDSHISDISWEGVIGCSCRRFEVGGAWDMAVVWDVVRWPRLKSFGAPLSTRVSLRFRKDAQALLRSSAPSPGGPESVEVPKEALISNFVINGLLVKFEFAFLYPTLALHHSPFIQTLIYCRFL